MILGTENNGLIALVAISLAALKDCLPIMEGSVCWANLNILIRNDTRTKPSLAFLLIHYKHVISKVSAKSDFGNIRFSL